MLLARMADAVYWTGRYLERAEGIARIVLVHTDAHVDLPVGRDVGWEPLLSIGGLDAEFSTRHRAAHETDPDADSDADSDVESEAGPRATEDDVVRFMLLDPVNPSSLVASLASARSNLRTARPVVPQEAWEAANNLWLHLGDHMDESATREGRVSWLRHVIAGCQQITGILVSTMNRDEARAFLSIGQNLERADLTSRVIDVRAGALQTGPGDDPYEIVHWMAVLRSLAAYQAFRRAMPARPAGGSTLRFLLQNDRFPRAVSASLTEIRSHLKELSRSDDALEACTSAAMIVAAVSPLRLDEDGLRAFVDQLQMALAIIHDRVEATYLNPTFDSWVQSQRSGDLRRQMPARRATDLYDSSPSRGRMVTDTAETEQWSRPTTTDLTSVTYAVSHRTTYRYAGPVTNSTNEAHLRPRSTERQRCLSSVLDIDPQPTTHQRSEDVFGNLIDSFTVDGSFDQLMVTAKSLVTVDESRALPPPLAWEEARDSLAEPGPNPLVTVFCADSAFVKSTGELRDYARPSFTSGRSVIEAVIDLNSRIAKEFEYDPGATSVATPLEEVLRYRRGVCQDFAHLAVGCMRSMGLAARYVSGYLETVPPPGGQRLIGADASHAWPSVLVPGWGCFDFDPTNDRVVDVRYITTAWGRDYADVTPLKGVVVGAGGRGALEVAVDVTRLEIEPVADLKPER